MKFAQKNRFGDKHQEAHMDEKKEDTADREHEKWNFMACLRGTSLVNFPKKCSVDAVIF